MRPLQGNYGQIRMLFDELLLILTSSPTLGHEPKGPKSQRERQPKIVPVGHIHIILVKKKIIRKLRRPSF